VSQFAGFSDAAVDFYERLEADNSRTFWLDNKHTFDTEIKGVMNDLLGDLPQSLGVFHVFRPNRDVRFSKSKEPYKIQHGAVSETEGGSILYVQFSAAGVMVGSGAYMMATDQLERYRQGVADAKVGVALERAIATVRAAGVNIGHGGFEPLKTAPRGFAKDHPRIELLRWKGCIATTTWSDRAIVGSAELSSLIVSEWKKSKVLIDWLDRHVGASQQSADD
jgi:uncharacterized protein (TIGR02453 family)